jgi:CheY-like chemotaxis protein
MNAQRKVLIVDDDPVVGSSFIRVLSGKGYIVVSAENGLDALKKLQEQSFDMVYTDLRMPGMDGIEVAENIRAAQPWVPVVIVTGYGTPANETRARAAGVSDFLRKPLSPEMIEDSAERTLYAASARAETPFVERRAVPPEPVAGQVAANEPVTAAAPAEPAASRGSTLKNMLLFLSAPFVGLLYILLLPLVGIGTLLWTATAALRQRQGWQTTKAILQRVGAPFIGLAYVLLLPIAGLATLAWMGLRALTRRAPAE